MKAINLARLKNKSKIIPLIILIVVIAVVLTALPYGVNARRTSAELPQSSFDERGFADRLHFMSFEGTDCVLIESNNRFALFYGAAVLDTEKQDTTSKISIADYLKLRASDDKGKVLLDYLICADSASDKIEGLAKLIKNTQIYAKNVYFKTLDFGSDKPLDEKAETAKELYYRVYEAILDKNTPISEIGDEELSLGDYRLKIIDTAGENAGKFGGDNGSLNVLVKKGDLAVFLAGNIHRRDMRRLKEKTGQVQLYKAPFGSGAKHFPRGFAKKLSPDYIIFSDKAPAFPPNLIWKLVITAGGALYGVNREGGIVADLSENKVKLCKIGTIAKVADSSVSLAPEPTAAS